MLSSMNAWTPNADSEVPVEEVSTGDTIWGTEATIDEEVGIDAYVV